MHQEALLRVQKLFTIIENLILSKRLRKKDGRVSNLCRYTAYAYIISLFTISIAHTRMLFIRPKIQTLKKFKLLLTILNECVIFIFKPKNRIILFIPHHFYDHGMPIRIIQRISLYFIIAPCMKHAQILFPIFRFNK